MYFQMRIKPLILILLLILTVLVSCVKSIELTDQDAQYTYTPRDIVGLDLDSYQWSQMSDGKDYFFAKTISKLNGFTSTYGASLFDRQQNKVIFTSNVNLQSSEARAVDLYNILIKGLSKLYKDSVVNIDPQDYKAEEVFLINSPDKFYLVLRKDELVYLVDIEGLALIEDEIKPRLLLKFQYVLAHKSEF